MKGRTGFDSCCSLSEIVLICPALLLLTGVIALGLSGCEKQSSVHNQSEAAIQEPMDFSSKGVVDTIIDKLLRYNAATDNAMKDRFAHSLSQLILDDVDQVRIGRAIFPLLSDALRSKELVGKGWLIVFCGRLGKGGAPYMSILEELQARDDEGMVSLSYKAAIPEAMKRISAQ